MGNLFLGMVLQFSKDGAYSTIHLIRAYDSFGVFLANYAFEISKMAEIKNQIRNQPGSVPFSEDNHYLISRSTVFEDIRYVNSLPRAHSAETGAYCVNAGKIIDPPAQVASALSFIGLPVPAQINFSDNRNVNSLRFNLGSLRVSFVPPPSRSVESLDSNIFIVDYGGIENEVCTLRLRES